MQRRQFQQGPSQAEVVPNRVRPEWFVSETWFETSRNGQSEDECRQLHGPFASEAIAREFARRIEEGTAKP